MGRHCSRCWDPAVNKRQKFLLANGSIMNTGPQTRGLETIINSYFPSISGSQLGDLPSTTPAPGDVRQFGLASQAGVQLAMGVQRSRMLLESYSTQESPHMPQIKIQPKML